MFTRTGPDVKQRQKFDVSASLEAIASAGPAKRFHSFISALKKDPFTTLVPEDPPMPPRPDKECLPYLRALSDESRCAIVRTLVSRPDPLTLGDLAGRLGLSDYSASRHVRILQGAGIFTVEREGRFKWIGITPGFRSRLLAPSGTPTLDLGCCRFDFVQKSPASRGKKQLPPPQAFLPSAPCPHPRVIS